jgi:Dyp-type peroxidase family
MSSKYRTDRDDLEKFYIKEKRRQPGIAFPSARKQSYTLIVRLDLLHSITVEKVKTGLRTLCGLFERIDRDEKRIEEISGKKETNLLPLSNFLFAATLGFGIGFFDKLKLSAKVRPKMLRGMPSAIELGDEREYVLNQTDLILQLSSSHDYVNRWVLDYSHDIHQYSNRKGKPGNLAYLSEDHSNINDVMTALRGWASIVDFHYGFQRLDGRNLMGFHDGISNPDRLSLDDIVWIAGDDDEPEALRDGTYMVFQKIEHDLEQWHSLDENKQEEWVGRSKHTGLLLGTLSKEDDYRLASDLNSSDTLIRKNARQRLAKLLEDQEDPNRKLFSEPKYSQVRDQCPVWSHVRKANPRQEDGAPRAIIYRRGYLFSETSPYRKLSSGILFICYQKNIIHGFELIKKEFLNNKNFPVLQNRKNFTEYELAKRHQGARFTEDEIRKFTAKDRSFLGIDHEQDYTRALQEADTNDFQNTGREGLSGPSELGVYSRGQFLATITMGGGYYFIPPIPNKRISDIGQQFFEDA